jgi:ketosteroid isomerase-like protein
MFPRKLFTPTLSCALVALCFFSGACAKKQKGVITEQQVNAFMEEMDKAANNNDVEAVVAMMSEDVQLSLTIEGFGPTQNMTFDREQYRAYSKQTMAMTDFYDYKRGYTVVKVEPDGLSAFVAAEITETSTIGEQTVGGVSRQTSTLEMVDGKLVITRSAAVMSPLPPVSQKAQRPTF